MKKIQSSKKNSNVKNRNFVKGKIFFFPFFNLDNGND